jgi:hypothetical protein
MSRLRDPWANGAGGKVPETFGGYPRPPRTEDRVERHAGNGMPKLWTPDGLTKKFYGRPSSEGKILDDDYKLQQWKQRQVAAGYLDFGDQSRVLRAERAALPPPESSRQAKDQHNELNKRAADLAGSIASRLGTAMHIITERADLGLEVNAGEFEPQLKEWLRIASYFDQITMPSGRPGVECFVALDVLRHDMDPTKDRSWIRKAGTFDRLWGYYPCPVEDDDGNVCGRTRYIVDLKTGRRETMSFSEPTFAVQESIYTDGEEYVEWPDGKGADRYPLPNVCPHRAITVSLPIDADRGQVKWTRLPAARDAVRNLIPKVRDWRAEKHWTSEFAPTPNFRPLIDAAVTEDEVKDVWRAHPGPHWNDPALVAYGKARIKEVMQ